MPEWLSFGIEFTIVGISIVFSALIIVATAVFLIRKLDDNWKVRETKQKEQAQAKEPTIDTTTIVLISAAVATMIAGRFHIRKIRRLLPYDAKSGPWSMEGRAILHGSHVVSKKR